MARNALIGLPRTRALLWALGCGVVIAGVLAYGARSGHAGARPAAAKSTLTAAPVEIPAPRAEAPEVIESPAVVEAPAVEVPDDAGAAIPTPPPYDRDDEVHAAVNKAVSYTHLTLPTILRV